jgi:hypothetical protein
MSMIASLVTAAPLSRRMRSAVVAGALSALTGGVVAAAVAIAAYALL